VTFTPGQVAALKKLRELWPDTPFVLVGASALGCFLDFRWRVTNDIDISVSIELDELPAGLDRLPGWLADPRAEHRWLAPEDVKVDILPAGPNLRRVGTLRWPRSGNELSLVGQRLAFEQAREVRVDPDLSIRVAPVPVVCVLKMVAYQDQPHARTRDLEDLAHIFDEYIPADDQRRYSDEVPEAGIEFDVVSAYLLGRDIGILGNSEERAAVAGFIARVRDENDPHATQARMANVAPVAWRRDPEALLARLEAFELGLNSTAPGAPR
jgi:predicted nucleotidyltransferase